MAVIVLIALCQAPAIKSKTTVRYRDFPDTLQFKKGKFKMICTVLKIDGMMCGMCEAHINDAVRKEFVVKKVTSSHSKGETVILSEKPLDKDKLNRVIFETGYDLKDISDSEYKKKTGFFGLFKK